MKDIPEMFPLAAALKTAAGLTGKIEKKRREQLPRGNGDLGRIT